MEFQLYVCYNCCCIRLLSTCNNFDLQHLRPLLFGCFTINFMHFAKILYACYVCVCTYMYKHCCSGMHALHCSVACILSSFPTSYIWTYILALIAYAHDSTFKSNGHDQCRLTRSPHQFPNIMVILYLWVLCISVVAIFVSRHLKIKLSGKIKVIACRKAT